MFSSFDTNLISKLKFGFNSWQTRDKFQSINTTIFFDFPPKNTNCLYFIYSTVTDSKCIYKYWELTKQRIAKQIELNASKVAGCLTFSEEEEKSYDIIIKRNETKQKELLGSINNRTRIASYQALKAVHNNAHIRP